MSKSDSSGVVVTEDPKTHVITIKGVMTIPPQMKAFVESITNPEKTKNFRRKRKQATRPAGASPVIYTFHPQVSVHGRNPKHGEYTIHCDEKMADVIFAINSLGVRTYWSCQGNDHDDEHAAYLVTEYPSQKNFRKVIRILEQCWKDRFIPLEVDATTRNLQMTFRAHHHVPHDPVNTEDIAMPCIYLHRPDDQTRWDGSEWEKGGSRVQ